MKYNEASVKKDETTSLHKHKDTLPLFGKSRFSQIKPFLPVSRETFRKLELIGKAPPRERLGIRCTFYDNAEVHKWLENPAGYRAPGH